MLDKDDNLAYTIEALLLYLLIANILLWGIIILERI